MINVEIVRQGLDGNAASEKYDTEDLCALLTDIFGVAFPAQGRIYHAGMDVTPSCAEDVERLSKLDGDVLVVVWPGSGFELQAFLFILSFVAQGIFTPEPPVATQRNVQAESPNNGLSDRTNQARVNGRIPDIFGTVRSTPDLIQVPYKVFQDHVEVEIAYMCIGRGSYGINSGEIYDDTTPAQEIAGMSVEVYGPNTSPNSGDVPQLRIGNAINTPVLRTQRVNSVNGQVLQPSDSGGSYRNGVKFLSPNIIQSQDSSVDYTTMFGPGDPLTVVNAEQAQGLVTYTPTTPYELLFEMVGSQGTVTIPGDVESMFSGAVNIIISANPPVRWLNEQDVPYYMYGSLGGVYEMDSVAYDGVNDVTVITLNDVLDESTAWANSNIPGTHPGEGSPDISRPSTALDFDLSGTYTINTVTSSTITLSSPATVNPDWDVLQDDFGGESQILFPNLFTSGERWIGEFTVRSNEPIRRLISNFVALQGLFADNGENQYAQFVDVRLEATPVDASGAAIGATEVFTGTVEGSYTTRSVRALTMQVDLAATSNFWKVRARRTSPKNLDFNGSVVDEVKWRDLYIASPVADSHFGNVTTVQSVSFATDGALAIKERKLNMLVTRMLPAWTGSGFTTELYPTNDFADILSFVCLDPYIGNRQADEVDFANFYDVQAQIKAYFGFDQASWFQYTFDNDNLSFEETVAVIAEANFCSAYRRGSLIRLSFERENDDSVLLFNHRNKVPGSDGRSNSFGWNAQTNDGVEYQYIDPSDDAPVFIYIPADQSAINPKRIESVGIRTHEQAHIHAWRLYNKLRYQNTTATFDALPEANLLILKDRVLLADNTRSGSQDGDIVSVNGLEVTLSQPMEWQSGLDYSIHLQNADGQVEAIDITPGADAYTAILAYEPRTPIVFSDSSYVKTTYIITDDSNARQARPFLVTEKGQPNDDTTVPITAINYDARYYQNDGDFRP